MIIERGTSASTNDGSSFARQPSHPNVGTIPAFTARNQPRTVAKKKLGMPIVTAVSAVATLSTIVPLRTAVRTASGMPNRNAQPRASSTSTSVIGPCSRRIEFTVRSRNVKVGPKSNRATDRR